MISVEQALDAVSEQAHVLEKITVNLADSVGSVLAQDVKSDIDIPPFNKSMMDGFAIQFADEPSDSVRRKLEGRITAGQNHNIRIDAGNSAEIMTGAAIPEGANMVVVKEAARVTQEGDDSVVELDGPFIAKQNMMTQGEILNAGQSVLSEGQLIKGQHLGILAEVGCSSFKVFRRPDVAILTTGNELVPIDQLPDANQIRNSNGSLLNALANENSNRVIDLGHATDEEDVLENRILTGLESDVLVITGGVSEGVLDLVPEILNRVGVKKVFHKVSLKPGKPIWFGIYESSQGIEEGAHRRTVLVFGLPGNPVSAFVCFQLFVKTVLLKLAGCAHNKPCFTKAEVCRDVINRGHRLLFHPGRLRQDGQKVEPLAWQGSADQTPFANCNCLIQVPPNESLSTGDSASVLKI